jgi:hypothetical protein
MDTLATIEIMKHSKLILLLKTLTVTMMLVSWLAHIIGVMLLIYKKYQLFEMIRRIPYNKRDKERTYKEY